MSDEKPVPATLETIAASIRELRQSMESRFGEVDSRFGEVDSRFDGVDSRFDGVDSRFDDVDSRFDDVYSRFDELKAQLRTEIESVRGDVKLVAEAVAAQTMHLQRHARTDKGLKKRLDDHDTRILALEPKSPGAPSA
jgi:DNA anti-recombination protein RmuC